MKTHARAHTHSHTPHHTHTHTHTHTRTHTPAATELACTGIVEKLTALVEDHILSKSFRVTSYAPEPITIR